MNRQFSLARILKMTPNSLLREFFEVMECPMLCVDWEHLKAHQYEPLLNALAWNPPSKIAEVEANLERIFELASAEGSRKILAAADRLGLCHFSHEFPPRNGYHQALWTWLKRPEVFAEAVAWNETELRDDANAGGSGCLPVRRAAVPLEETLLSPP